MKSFVTAAVLLVMLAEVNSVPLESVRLLALLWMACTKSHPVCVCVCLHLCCVTMAIVQYHKDSKPSCTVNCFSSHSTILSANEQGVPSESYLQEVQEQLEERSQESEENQHQREARSASDNIGLYQCNDAILVDGVVQFIFLDSLCFRTAHLSVPLTIQVWICFEMVFQPLQLQTSHKLMAFIVVQQ